MLPDRTFEVLQFRPSSPGREWNWGTCAGTGFCRSLRPMHGEELSGTLGPFFVGGFTTKMVNPKIWSLFLPGSQSSWGKIKGSTRKRVSRWKLKGS